MQKPGKPVTENSKGPLAQAGWWRSTIAPLLAIFALAVLTGYLLDSAAIDERGAWPSALYALARQLTNLGKSGWILVSSALVLAAAFLTLRKAATAGMQAKAKDCRDFRRLHFCRCRAFGHYRQPCQETDWAGAAGKLWRLWSFRIFAFVRLWL